MHLIDVNVWLALAFERHPHHQPSIRWFASAAPDSCVFCRVTQMSFLRLASNPKVFGEQALTLNSAWLAYREFQCDPRIVYADEPVGIVQQWRAYTQHNSYSHKIWTDAYLAAFARVADFELVTFDRGFAPYNGLKCKILT